jgi:hypothetical protein
MTWISLDTLQELRPDDVNIAEISVEAMAAALRGADLIRRLQALARR